MDKTQIFIEKAIKLHGDKYDYSNTVYKGRHSKLTIICKTHGEFIKEAGSHLSGYGCSLCTVRKREYKTKLNNDEFIEKCKLIHSNKYDYSKVNYKGTNKKIIIICKEHGEFIQDAGKHLQGQNCKQCCIKKMTSSTNNFIEKSKKIHGDKYDYSKVNYINNTKKIIIICKDHGEFLQSPASHLAEKGCNKCGNLKSYYANHNFNYDCTSNTEEFIKKAKLKYENKYNYSKVIYKIAKQKVIIICKEHGEFLQTPSGHLYGYEGCNKCNSTNYSKSQIEWLEILSKLNNIKIQHAMNNGEFKIPTTNYKADGYCKERNTIYEFHGDYWHGNPKIFNSNELNKTVGKTYSELYENTLKREQEIKDLGFNLEVMWESDWNKINISIKKLQKKFRLKN